MSIARDNSSIAQHASTPAIQLVVDTPRDDRAQYAQHWRKQYAISPTKTVVTSQRARKLLRESLAEFFGTLLLVFLGNAAGVQQFMAADTPNAGSFLNVAIAWGLALSLSVLISTPAGPAHLNPATTVTMALFGKYSKRRAGFLIFAQFLAGAVAAILVLSLYPSLPRHAGTMHCLCTYPRPDASLWLALRNEIFATAIIHIVVFATNDKRHKLSTVTTSAILGGTLIAIGLCMGFHTGYALNPARDLGPRVVSMLFGWPNAFEYRSYAWVPVVGPLLGAPIGGVLYNLFIGWSADEDAENADYEQRLRNKAVNQF